MDVLNNLLILHIHKESTEKLNLRDVATKFIGDSEYRLKIYGKFESCITESDVNSIFDLSIIVSCNDRHKIHLN